MRIEHPKPKAASLIVREDVDRELRSLAASDHSDRSLYEYGECVPDP